MIIKKTVIMLALIIFAFSSNPISAMNKIPTDASKRLSLLKATDGPPTTQNCSHRVGNVLFTITNWGFFGSQYADGADWMTEDFCLGPGVVEGELAPSFEFPAGSGINYLYQGALWISAIVNDDTLCSVGADGWQRTNEMYPTGAPEGDIIQLSSRKSSPFFSDFAISEQDYIAEYTDTLTEQDYTGQDAVDNRGHQPVFVKVIQKSYSWSYSYAEDFVLMDFNIINIGVSEIRKAYLGLYVDADIWREDAVTDGFADDITGYLADVSHPACAEHRDSINIAWTADFDGDPDGSVFHSFSPTGVAGTRVIRSPNDDLKFSFNWWVSNGNASLDWGPRLTINNRDWGHGGLGTPEGDRNKYYIMSKREFDYDQLWADVDFTDNGWLPPNSSIGRDLADGFDTRYLFSFGPFDIGVGDTLPVTIGYIAGDKFHTDPNVRFDSKNPQQYYDQLNFDDFATNALWAGWVYDNPGVDTDGDGYAGEEVFCESTGEYYFVSGDGEPDFAGPPPPSPPIVRFSASPGKVTLNWNGRETEQEIDPFSTRVDFEGYEVYMSKELRLQSFSLLTSFDHENYDRYELDLSYEPHRWDLINPPFTPDSLNVLHPDITDLDFESYNFDNPLVYFDENNDTSAVYYFQKHGFNRSEFNNDNGIIKIYPEADTGTWIFDEKIGEWVDAYYEYEFSINGLLPSQPLFFSVGTIDFGDPQTDVAPLKSSPLANAVEIYPVYSADQVNELKLDVQVFPNPYKGDGSYRAAGYESQTGDERRAREIHFMNLPERATIRIFTLDGDLVRQLEHPCNCPFQEGESMMYWDLISKNTQAIVSGIYLYSIESELGNQVGKLVIIL